MRISINEDLESGEFKENFFYHFTQRETAFLAAGLGVGGGVYALSVFALGIPREQTTLIMVVAVLPILMTGFYKYQGFNFVDFARKYILLRLCTQIHWRSTEDPDEVLKLRIANIRVKPTLKQKGDIGNELKKET